MRALVYVVVIWFEADIWCKEGNPLRSLAFSGFLYASSLRVVGRGQGRRQGGGQGPGPPNAPVAPLSKVEFIPAVICGKTIGPPNYYLAP